MDLLQIVTAVLGTVLAVVIWHVGRRIADDAYMSAQAKRFTQLVRTMSAEITRIAIVNDEAMWEDYLDEADERDMDVRMVVLLDRLQPVLNRLNLGLDADEVYAYAEEVYRELLRTGRLAMLVFEGVLVEVVHLAPVWKLPKY